jgi:hypothetical protein
MVRDLHHSVKETQIDQIYAARILIKAQRRGIRTSFPMKILEYIGLDTSRVKAPYRKVTDAIARGDFHAAQVKTLANLTHGKFYRAKLDGADRLLFSLVRHGDEVCALMLEVIAHHDYDKSRFLRGATIDESRIPDGEVSEAMREAQPVRYLHPESPGSH